MSKFIILGDCHIGSSQNLSKQFVGSALNSRIIDQSTLLDWAHSQATNNGVNNIILTGDIFEEPKPHYSLVILFFDWLLKCSDSGISVHIVAGNHDILRSGQSITSPLDILYSSEIKNVFFYKRITTVNLDRLSITFLPFRDRRSFNTDINSDALTKVKSQVSYAAKIIDNNDIKILVGHLALEGSIPVGYELGELSNELFCPLDMFSGYDYVWMGHVHKFQVMSESPHIAHIGSMDISNFGETEHTKYIMIFDPNQDEKVKYVEIPTRKLNHIKIELPENIDNVSEFIENKLKDNNVIDSIVKVSIVFPSNTKYSIDRVAIEKSLQKSGAFHISKISEERTFQSLKKQINETLDNNVNEISAIKSYATIVDDYIRDEFIKLASEIVQEYKETGKN